MVHYDWMISAYRWMGVPEGVCRVIEALTRRWKTRLEVWVKTGFLQGDWILLDRRTSLHAAE